jgi:very-short-patch-repair endonuclease
MQLSTLDSIATANHGLVSRETSGLSRSSWYRAVASGHLEQLFPGVARLPGTARTREQRIAAAVLATGPSSLASHRSAAHLWGVPRPPDDPVDVILVGARRRFVGFDDVVIHRPRDLERLRPQRRANIVCTNIMRTVLDLGAVDPSAVPDAVGHVITNRLATLQALETVVIQHSEHGRTGIVALREAVAEWSIDRKPTDSLLEQTMRRLIDRYRLAPVEFHPVICGYEVDFRVLGTPVILECDGWAYHGLERTNFERDRRRDADLIAAGWIVLRFTYRAITTRPKETADRIAATVAQWT